MSFESLATDVSHQFDSVGASVASVFAKARGDVFEYIKSISSVSSDRKIIEPESRYLDDVWVEWTEQSRDKRDSLSSLLDRLDDAFTSITLPESGHSWPLRRSEVAAMKKIGPFVPDTWRIFNWESKCADDWLIDPNNLPNIALAHFVSTKQDADGKVFPRFMFAIKHERLPDGVERYAGTPYMFGLAYCLTDEAEQPSIDKKIRWIWCWIVVSKSGRVVVPKQKRDITHRVLRRRRSSDGRRSETFTTRNWYSQSMVRFTDSKKEDAEHRMTNIIASEFKTLIVWWRSRSKMWSVSAYKNKQRMTFCVSPSRAVKYFRNRDKTAIASDGKRKRILHIVKEHTRHTGSTVKQHIRGAADFLWNGYACHIVAPKFTGFIATSEFALDPFEVDDDDLSAEKGIELPELADMLISAEETDSRLVNKIEKVH